MTVQYAPTTASLVRRPRFGAQPTGAPRPIVPQTAPTPGTTQPYGGNGVLPQPPAAPPGSTAIDPNNNLQGVQINPVNAADTDAARAGVVAQTQAVTGRATPQVNFQTVGRRLNFNGVNPNAQFNGVNPNVQAGAAVDPVASARLRAQQGQLDDSASKLAGVDRLKLAQEQFGTYANATDPTFQKSIRDATEAAGAHGGLGSGMLTNQYGDLATTRARDLQTERDRLFQSAQEGSIQDQFNKVQALQGLAGQTAGEEAATRGEQRTDRGYATDVATGNVARTQAERDAALSASERNIGRTQAERDAALGVDTSNLGLDISERNKGLDVAGANADRTTADDYRKLGAASDLFSSLGGADASARNEYRTERTNQQGQAQAAEDSAVRRTQLEEALKSGDFERALALAQYGDAGNPGAATLGVAGQQAGQNSQDLEGLIQLLTQYGYGKARAA